MSTEKTIECIAKEKCNGCKACGDICPTNAIEYYINDEGFWYPRIDKNKCVECGRCKKICSAITESSEKEAFIKEVYAAWNNNPETRRDSTSGGVYSAFAEYVLSEGGYIVGSRYSSDFKSAYHIYGNTRDDLDKILGSKYFQSDTEGIYKATSELLNTGKMVLFTGTPCQVRALKNYLGQEYDNLISIDFICRGVPSPLIHRKKIEIYEKKGKGPVKFYRDKFDKYAWIHFGERIILHNGKEIFVSRWKDRINDCFVKYNFNVRESCYSCNYKNGNNYSEITIGDFWGIQGVTEKDLTEGVSALIINDVKGRDFFERVRSQKLLYSERRTLKEVINGNEAYYKSITKPENRKEFFDTVINDGLMSAVNKNRISKYERKAIKKRIFRMKHRRFLPVYRNRKGINWFQFIKYNFFCKQIIRQKDAFLMPFKGSVLQLSPKSKLTLNASLYLNYYPCYKRAGRTSLLRVEDGGHLVVNNDVEISYNNTISVDFGAYVEMGHFYTGVGANLICKKKMIIGNNVMLGRDVCLFDSDYHCIYNQNGDRINPDKEIIIEDNVWIGARSMVLKGAKLRSGSIISANSMVMGETEANKVYINIREKKSVGEEVIWER